ncbi:MAG TPA: Uma2 family endonuclease [Gemmataceae bacterium]|nr:Uma2 family endonuclease [Gemmataceae bacterium]
MASVPARRFETMADLLEDLGNVSPRRVRLDPPPGKATERDVVRIHDRTGRLYELVDGTLVEKVMGFSESALTCEFIRLLGNFVVERGLGFLTGPDGAVRLMPRLVRIPDIAFISWDQLPAREIPAEPIPDLAPALAVEVLSEGNTPAEMERKLKEYFLSGVRVVWFVDPDRRTVTVYTAPDRSVTLNEGDTLDGGDVLPGLSLPVRQVFAGRRPRERAAGRPARGRGKKGKRRPGAGG